MCTRLLGDLEDKQPQPAHPVFRDTALSLSSHGVSQKDVTSTKKEASGIWQTWGLGAEGSGIGPQIPEATNSKNEKTYGFSLSGQRAVAADT